MCYLIVEEERVEVINPLLCINRKSFKRERKTYEKENWEDSCGSDLVGSMAVTPVFAAPDKGK